MPQNQILKETSVNQVSKPVKKSRKRIIVIFLVSLLILAVAGGVIWWIIWGRLPSFLGDQINFSIFGTKEIASGNKVDLTVVYTNNEKIALKDLEINILYPDGFIFEGAEPVSQKDVKNIFTKEKLAPGEQDKIAISGRLLGNPKETKKFYATISFKPENVSSRFSKETEFDVLVAESQLQLETTLPTTVLENEILKYKTMIKNTGEETVENLQIKMDFPASFEINQTDPKRSGEENIWNFQDIKPGQEEIIEIEGRLYAQINETKVFKIQAGQKNEKGDFYLQNEKEVKVRVAKFDLSLRTQVNGEENLNVNLGSDIELKIHYKNKSSENLPNVLVEASIDENLFDKSLIEVSSGKYEKGKIIWDKTTKNEFASLDKTGEGDLSVRLKILPELAISSLSDKNFSAKFKAKLTSDLKELGREDKYIRESNEAEAKINTQVGYNIEIRYYDQNNKKPVGSGPLPPRVGFETTYWVYLNLTNTTNDVEKAKAEIYLPKEGISFAGGKTSSLGILDFFDGKIIWNIDKLQGGIGKIKPQLQASFDISITPDKTMVGKVPKLIEKSSFSGIDLFTGNEIKIDRGILTTELERDLKAKEIGGKVVE
ncbi:MAG: hypothetical protein AB1465_03435 [Patescibacteria group bacterium]